LHQTRGEQGDPEGVETEIVKESARRKVCPTGGVRRGALCLKKKSLLTNPPGCDGGRGNCLRLHW